ncbi:hypothetical protein DTO013E5_8654 [Penicillium roqueforti]|uniref:Major facilitator superfamily n=1 Tax=Penicillium roqueforti (strain FM164) TaxID=1365484 RepID=W6QP74_PENRF|nr:hypothetical protein CBS147355_7442 [Penicillium roqueforti]CDM38220.1 Major facilitator superfamily [Penicillium roqueforti FM164]KAI2684934.1 hypothetical protein LCP963914a_5026 [Penicillium roqueforti]KAI2697165.1 hypothetical protein CBS147372_7903 [Penicillium roqueforti]KAI2710876.1 hypothetical protein CBS147354_8456 [Penicillium roqueforti]
MGQQDLPSESIKPDLGILKVESISAARDVDLGQLFEVETTPEMEKKVLRKLDFFLIPLMGGCYMLQYIDKLAISQATLFNLRQDLGLKGNEYNWASAIFYFGYFAWSWPSSYLVVRLPLGKYLSCAVCVWGGCVMCHAACTNWAGLMAARFFLGIGEASIAPGFALITGMFYTRAEQPARQAAWFIGNSIAVLLGGLIAYGIGNIHGTAVAQWQLLFLVLGAITSLYGVLLFFTLPDSPAKAVFLKPNEQAIAVHRTLKNKTGVLDTGKFQWGQVLMAVKDLQTWFLVLYTLCVNFCNGGLTSFSAIIITGFGFPHLEALLIQMPIGGAQLVFLILTSGIASLVPKSRIIMMMVNTSVSMVGMILILKLDSDNQAGKMTGLCLGGVFAANIPLSLSLISSNVAGFTKKSTVSALMFAAYCVGNIVGPQFFIPSEEPSYLTGIKASMAGLAFGIFFLACLYLFYVSENRRRDRLYGSPVEMTETEELQDELSNKTDHEIESFRYVL